MHAAAPIQRSTAPGAVQCRSVALWSVLEEAEVAADTFLAILLPRYRSQNNLCWKGPREVIRSFHSTALVQRSGAVDCSGQCFKTVAIAHSWKPACPTAGHPTPILPAPTPPAGELLLALH